MKTAFAAIAMACAVFVLPAHAVTIDPIPGSLIYPTQPKTKLRKAPVGSLVTHEFHSGGTDYTETYRIGPDRELKLLHRRTGRTK